MPHYDVREVRQSLTEFLTRRREVSLRRFSRMTGEFTDRTVSPALISCLRNDKTPGGEISQEILEVILRTIKLYEKQVDNPVLTRNMQQILAVCERSKADQSMIVFIGESGYGKTFAFREYLHRNKEVIAITANVGMRKRALLQELCKAIGYRYYSRMSPHQILLDLASMESEQILIDEADKLSTESFECLRFLRDNGGTSIIFLGLPSILHKLRTSSNKTENLAQLYSRINYCKILEPPTEEEIGDIVKAMGIKKDDVVTAVVKNSKDKYTQKKNLHRVEEIVKELKRTAVTNKTNMSDIPADWVEAIAADMIGGESI